jgi:cbb3-type cytochrome oxidase maturation protein
MDILYLLIPFSAILVLGILGVFAWALNAGQFDDLESKGRDILAHDDGPFDDHQPRSVPSPEQ